MGNIIEAGLAPSTIGTGTSTPILALELVHRVGWEGTQNHTVTEIDNHNAVGLPSRTGQSVRRRSRRGVPARA
jgi:hypothetical protein